MSTANERLEAIKTMIRTLSPEQQGEVFATATEIHKVISQRGAYGVLALAMVGAELSVPRHNP